MPSCWTRFANSSSSSRRSWFFTIVSSLITRLWSSLARLSTSVASSPSWRARWISRWMRTSSSLIRPGAILALYRTYVRTPRSVPGPPYALRMASVEWVKWKIHEEWEASLPDRYDPEKAAAEADADGVIRNYENSYDMHHKVVEATRQEVMELMRRQDKAEQGLIVWDEKKQELREISDDSDDSQGELVEKLELEIWTDGSNSGYGVLIEDGEGNRLREMAARLLKGDFSEAEYLAVILGLREAHALGAERVTLYCDSKFLVDQMNGRAKAREMAEYYEEASKLAKLVNAEVVKIEGKENPADGLSKMFAGR